MQSPVLFIVFNRPETTHLVFEAIRAARPPRLYVAADGPRPDRPGESERCREVRELATAVDWPCELHTLFRDSNLGCKMGVSGAISWFFENEEEGIILEDDVLPERTFFPYCDELLGRYRHDDRIVAVSGCNLISGRFRPRESYLFSRYNSVWGWASWRRAWKHYDVNMDTWPEWRDRGGLARLGGKGRPFESYWRRTLDATHRGEIDTWDFQWTFACWRLNGLSILPAANQTKNLGFGPGATHTRMTEPEYVRMSPPSPLVFPLQHPDPVVRCSQADELLDRHVFGVGYFSMVKNCVRAVPLLGTMLRHLKNLLHRE